MAVVTIARQFGAGGLEVAELLAARIGAQVIDKALIEEVTQRARLPASEVEAMDEKPRGLLDAIIRSFAPMPLGPAAWEPPYPSPLFDPRPEILDITQAVIRQVAVAGDAVIVGRGAAIVLRDRPRIRHVFLRAPLEARIARVMARERLAEAAAHRLVLETDANRSAYIHQVYGTDRLDPTHYDLIIDTDRLGINTTVEVIVTSLADAKGPSAA